MADSHAAFLKTMRDLAWNAGHIWPEYAACEAALESAWGASQLFTQGDNVFGRKQSYSHPIFETLDLPTTEIINGEPVHVMAHWVKYPSLGDSFKDRMELLQRMASAYPHYLAALAAPDGETFIREVSQTWSTDPQRAEKVLAIYNAHYKEAFGS